MKYMFQILVVLCCLVMTQTMAQTVDCSGAAAWNTSTAYSTGAQVKYNGILYTANWWTQGNQPDISSGASGSGQPWLVNGTCSTSSKAARTISITSANSGTVGNTISLQYNAVPSTTSVTWTVTNGASGTSGAATLSGSTLSLTTAGMVTVTVVVAEDASYYSATATQTITISSSTASALDCSSVGIWDATLVYNGGDQAKYNGVLYQAKWWTQGNEPDTDNGTGATQHWTLVGTCTTGGTTTNFPWVVTGNNNANSHSFIGTTNSQYLSFRANNIEAMRLHPFSTLQLGGLTTTADSYFKLDVTGRVAMRPDPGTNQNNILLLYSNNQSTTRYLAGFKQYTGFSHTLLGTMEVGVMNTVEYNSTSGVTVGKHLLLQNTAEGNLGIGIFTTAPTAKLSVNGTSYLNGNVTMVGDARLSGKLASLEVFVTHNPLTDNWPDYVFSKKYELKPLKELEEFINTHHHLPEIPSASDVKDAGGISLGEMNALLLKKVEELTLYVIEQNKKIEELEKKIDKK